MLASAEHANANTSAEIKFCAMNSVRCTTGHGIRNKVVGWLNGCLAVLPQCNKRREVKGDVRVKSRVMALVVCQLCVIRLW